MIRSNYYQTQSYMFTHSSKYKYYIYTFCPRYCVLQDNRPQGQLPSGETVFRVNHPSGKMPYALQGNYPLGKPSSGTATIRRNHPSVNFLVVDRPLGNRPPGFRDNRPPVQSLSEESVLRNNIPPEQLPSWDPV